LTAAGAEAFTGNAACVYATGSVGRGEASEHSDLDVFLVSTGEFKQLDAIRLMAKLIDATEAVKFPPFSGDGEYLKTHKVSDLIRLLGTPEDDHTNVFTACSCCSKVVRSSARLSTRPRCARSSPPTGATSRTMSRNASTRTELLADVQHRSFCKTEYDTKGSRES
jgi:hypothetical protein